VLEVSNLIVVFYLCFSAPIPTVVEHLNGESSDEDSDDDKNRANSSVHSTTAVPSKQPHCM